MSLGPGAVQALCWRQARRGLESSSDGSSPVAALLQAQRSARDLRWACNTSLAFRVKGLGFQGFRVSGFQGFRVLGFRVRV